MNLLLYLLATYILRRRERMGIPLLQDQQLHSQSQLGVFSTPGFGMPLAVMVMALVGQAIDLQRTISGIYHSETFPAPNPLAMRAWTGQPAGNIGLRVFQLDPFHPSIHHLESSQFSSVQFSF